MTQLTIDSIVAAYGTLKENIAALEVQVKALRPHIDAYLEANPAERTQFGDWELVCSVTRRIVTDMKKLERKVGKRVMRECQSEVEGTQVKVVRVKQLDLTELVPILEAVERPTD